MGSAWPDLALAAACFLSASAMCFLVFGAHSPGVSSLAFGLVNAAVAVDLFGLVFIWDRLAPGAPTPPPWRPEDM